MDRSIRETELLIAARVGDSSDSLEAFFEAAFSEVYPYLYRRCGHVRATAEDLTQDTFATAVGNLQRGQVEYMTIGWLIRCAQSRFIDYCRRESRRERHLRAVTADAPELLEDGVIADRVMTELLGHLPASQRVAIVLHHLDGLSVADVAQELDRTDRAVESLLARGRRNLRVCMEDQSHGA